MRKKALSRLRKQGKKLGMKQLGNGIVKKLIDANVVLRYLLQDDDALFQKASALLERVKVGEEAVVIPESVIAECVYVLLKVYKINRQIISEKLKGLFAYKGIVNPDKKDLIDSLVLFGQTQLSIVDCIACSKSINNGMSLFTFDDDLKTIYAKQLKSST
jgi:predicted nucleic-acid-binding protein